jgi:methionine-gamma-lyase
MSVLRSGDAVLAGSLYGCTDSLLRGLSKFGIGAVFSDLSKTDEVEAVLDAHPEVVLVLLESPENPTLRVCDIEAISRLTEARGVLLAVDNTFCSPYLQQPFRLGADFVIHSLTKFINGHSTSVGGAVMGPFRFMREELFEWYKDLGATPSPFDSWLNSTAVQSLLIREKTQSESAALIAGFLRTHPKVEWVAYPGFDDFPQREVARKQMRSGGGLVSFEVRGGIEAGEKVMNYFTRRDAPMELAVSLGAAISYIQHPASMTHAVVPEADRLARGITAGLVRLSVGLEGTEELIEHLDRALALI